MAFAPSRPRFDGQSSVGGLLIPSGGPFALRQLPGTSGHPPARIEGDDLDHNPYDPPTDIPRTLLAVERLLLGFWSLFLNPRRLLRSSVILKSSTLLRFHATLKDRKYRWQSPLWLPQARPALNGLVEHAAERWTIDCNGLDPKADDPAGKLIHDD
jgi:hypothetical protein